MLVIKYLVLLVCFLGFRLYTTTSSVNVNEAVEVKQVSPEHTESIVKTDQQDSINIQTVINYGFLILGGLFVIRDFREEWEAKP